jgi:hypothetical protein
VCDFTVIFGRSVILFSDKATRFKPTGNIAVDWGRWFRSSIEKSARQVRGAVDQIRLHCVDLFLDAKCTMPFPYGVPKGGDVEFFRILVVNNVSQVYWLTPRKSGRLALDTAIKGCGNHTIPFLFGDLYPSGEFFHVFERPSLDLVLVTLDTIEDLLDYLRKREALFRSGRRIQAACEEDLLAIYLQHWADDGTHDFPPGSQISVKTDEWGRFQTRPERLAQLEAIFESEIWDRLIADTGKLALADRLEATTKGGFRDVEHILRLLAGERRLSRRRLSKVIKELHSRLANNPNPTALLPPFPRSTTWFLIMFLDSTTRQPADSQWVFLKSACKVVRYLNPDAKDIVGLATDSDRTSLPLRETLVHFDGTRWSSSDEAEAKLHHENGMLRNLKTVHMEIAEYPQTTQPPRPPATGNLRNKPCTCGSKRKAKRCCYS